MPDPPARVILPAPWAPRTRLLAAPASDAPHSRARRRARLLPAPATSLIDARKVPRVPPRLRHPHADLRRRAARSAGSPFGVVWVGQRVTRASVAQRPTRRNQEK